MIDNSYAPGFKTKLHSKDLRIAKNITSKKNLSLKGTNLVNKYMIECNKQGYSEKRLILILQYYKK